MTTEDGRMADATGLGSAEAPEPHSGLRPTGAIPCAGLRACPFCGGEASDTGHIRYRRPLADTAWADGSPITEAFFVNCISCGVANGRPGLVGGYQTKAEAIARWNTRA